MLNTTTTANGTEHSHHLLLKDYVLVVLHTLVFIIGTTGNFLVCKFFKLEQKSLTHIQHWIFYLAVTDLFTSVLDPLLYIYWKLTFYDRWDFGGNIGCKIIPVISKTCKTTSFGILMLLNIERCLQVLFPYRLAWSVCKNRLILGVIVVLGFVLNIHNVIHTDLTPINDGYHCFVPLISIKSYGYPDLMILVTRDMLFLTVFIVTNIAIKREFKRPVFQSTKAQSRRNRENMSIRKTLFVISVGFIILVFPREVLKIVYQTSWLMSTKGIVYTKDLVNLNSFLKFVQSLNNIYNVFVYAKIHRHFHRSVKRSLTISDRRVERKPKNLVIRNCSQSHEF